MSSENYRMSCGRNVLDVDCPLWRRDHGLSVDIVVCSQYLEGACVFYSMYLDQIVARDSVKE